MPQTCLSILQHLQKRQMEAAARIVERETVAIYNLRAKRPGYRTLVIKEAMNLCGKEVGPVRPPLAPLPEVDREELRGMLARWGLLKSQDGPRPARRDRSTL